MCEDDRTSNGNECIECTGSKTATAVIGLLFVLGIIFVFVMFSIGATKYGMKNELTVDKQKEMYEKAQQEMGKARSRIKKFQMLMAAAMREVRV